MNLYIRIKNGQPVEHPMMQENFVACFPNININNLPSEFARFIRVEPPTLAVYEVCEGCTYEWEGDYVTDVHHVRDMTQEEKIAKQDAAKALWAENGYTSWVFNEKTCSFDPPAPYPTDGNPYRWDEETTSWTTPTLPVT